MRQRHRKAKIEKLIKNNGKTVAHNHDNDKTGIKTNAHDVINKNTTKRSRAGSHDSC